jgi:hypothetical protein
MGEGDIDPPFLIWEEMEVSSQFHTPAILPPGKQPLVPIYRRLGRLRSQSGCYGEKKTLLPCWELNPDSSAIQPVA